MISISVPPALPIVFNAPPSSIGSCKLAQKVTPALLVIASVLVIRQVLVTKSQEGVLALFLKGHTHMRFETARMERHPGRPMRWIHQLKVKSVCVTLARNARQLAATA